MNQDKKSERTDTGERIENAKPSPRPIVEPQPGGPEIDPKTGLLKGTHDDDSSPLDSPQEKAHSQSG